MAEEDFDGWHPILSRVSLEPAAEAEEEEGAKAMNFESFKKLVNASGLTAVDRGRGHWQISGGPLLVNYYPVTGRYYVAGTKSGMAGTLEDAIQAARFAPTAGPKRDHRKNKNRRSAKKRLFKRQRTCRWCGCRLTLLQEDAWNGVELATLEHVIPLNLGGLDNANNWALACEPCNRARGGQMPGLEKREESTP